MEEEQHKKALTQAQEEREKARQEYQAKENAITSQPLPNSPPKSAPPEHVLPASNTPSMQVRTMTIIFEYDTANEAQIKAHLDAIKELCTKFGARYR